jgi:hypothetical protein
LLAWLSFNFRKVLEELAYFVNRQLFNFSGWQPPQHEGVDTYPVKVRNLAAHGLEHAPDVVVAPLMNDEAIPKPSGCGKRFDLG